MNHKLSTFLLVFACFLGLNASLWGQNAAAKHGIRGYLDPQTGAFHTIPHPDTQDGAAPVAMSTFTGKLVVTFTITVNSTIAATTKIGCQVDADVEDVGTGNFISESAASAVVRGSAATVTCKATIPYSWSLATATESSDMINMTYSITSPVAIATAAGEFPLRISSQSLTAIKVPPTGTVTSIAVAATI